MNIILEKKKKNLKEEKRLITESTLNYGDTSNVHSKLEIIAITP